MPGKVKVKILAGRNLPVMDRSSDTTDAYVEIKLGSITQKTDVFRKSLNPQWNSEWFIFEVDDAELQDEPLQIRLMDYDTYSANDAIGKVYLDLNPLLVTPGISGIRGIRSEACSVPSSGGHVLSGWLPVYDTMHGMRGEVSVIVKVELFSDVNKFRQSSCGVQFFSTPSTPHGFKIQSIQGFVKELVVNDDPEYQWIDKIRTPRASNEARQTLFSQLSGEVRRKIGLKVLELGGNAVVGYQQMFDLEGVTGLVVRGIGTAVTLARCHFDGNAAVTWFKEQHHGSSGRESPRCAAISPVDVVKPLLSTAAITTPVVVHGITPSRPSPCRRSSESEINTTPKASSLSDSFGSSGGGVIASNCRPTTHRQTSVPAPPTNAYLNTDVTRNLEVLEYPFLTMKTYPPGFIVHIGGTVSARSVKLLDRINNSEGEPETRDNWWTEIRMEVRSHARALGCSVILGYEEHTSISDEVCVLSASGTAAVVKLQHTEVEVKDINYHGKGNPLNAEESKVTLPCRVCHIPYSKASIPFPIKLSRCALCRKGKVPDVLIATIEPPTGMNVTGRGCLIQARLCRPKRAESRGDQQAKEVSDGLPFLEYELHRQLINKLRTKGMNSIFHLKVQVSIGERYVVGVATGTALFLSALPTPSLPTPSNPSISSKQSKRGRINKLLIEAHATSQERYGLNKQLNKVNDMEETKWTDSDDTDEDANDLDLTAGNKDSCVIEIDDVEDIDVIELLIDPETPEGFDVVTTETVPGLPIDNIRRHPNLQAFNRVWKGKIPSVQAARHLNRCFEMILRSIYFKLRKSRPCVITNLQFSVDLPEDDEIQISVLGTAITSFTKIAPESAPCIGVSLRGVGSTESEMIFHLEDDVVQLPASNEPAASMTKVNQQIRHIPPPPPSNQGLLRTAGDKAKFYVQKERQPVDIVTLIHLPGSRVERYLGHLNFFFIRESTSIREDGGLSGFMQSFITEVLGIVRAHVSALGGNAMVSYFMTQCVLLHNPHKNQGQCLINVGGDVVQAVRCSTDKDVSNHA
ncbi:C2 domain-containing protein 5-like isoform X3 [Daphnia pulicaria]|uniref:C2 domain-containing protein 5-like isoform X3 n=1 Tax=Daphnia pulicaria TaxID=35523 RepID=UPI001EEBB37F|nr:C2 domain-containing protein 5-like isoform X3 [Daphnia pulicaria]